MSADAKAIALAMVVLILASGCAGATPPPVPVLPSATLAPPTATAAMPTETPSPTKAPILPTVTPELAPDESSLTITYTCNDGFIIAFHGKKVLVDALFREPGIQCYTDPGQLDAMTRGEPPFDGVDLILISHAHSDHFDPQIVGTFLQNNPQAALVSMVSVIDELKKQFSGFAQVRDRVHSIQLAEKESTQMTIHGIDLEIISAPADVPNLGFLIQIGRVTLFHAGDSGSSRETVDLFQSYHLPDKRIELAFVPWQYLGDEWYHPLVKKGIQAKNYVPMHYAGDDAAKVFKAVSTYYPQAILFRKAMQAFVYSPPIPPTATPVPTWALAPKPTSHATPRPTSMNVLFIGNSHTFTNNLPEMFADLAQSGNHPVHADASAIGGYTLEQHTTDSRTLTKIAGARWSYVILQESTARSPAETAWSERLIPAARTLDKKIKDANARTVLFMTWASPSTYAKGGLESFAAEQALAATQFLALARELDAPVAPVGLAWENALRARPELKLWQSDQVHATYAGTYLMACVLYAAIFQQSPDGLSYTADLSEDTARFLQRIATETVLPPTTPAPSQMPPGQVVSFTAEDGVKLAGALYPANGDTGVVLAHMGIADQKSWQSFAGYIAGRGFTALTFDFRCYGLSECGKMGQSESLFALDIRAAIRFLRERGVKRIVCMGASMGGTACMNAALEEELAGMVVIASPAPLYMGKEYPKDLVNPEMTKLFIVTEKDRFAQVVPATYSLYDRSPGPKKLGIFPGTVHGTELFATQSGLEFRDLLTRFMEELATPAKP
jgi:L-ascorbate metabolism protein UlaG (beta-lactamase superfamily)/dienelactone hydrolase